MNTVMARKRRFKEIADFLWNPADIEVFGMFGPGNLGDEAMRIAALEVLTAKRAIGVVPAPRRFMPVRSLMRKRTRKDILVAGGTLIHGGPANRPNEWLDYVEMRVGQGARLSCCGTGIAFRPDQIEQRSDSYTRWQRLLKGASLVALRGPLSCGVAEGMGAKAEVFGDFAFLFHDPARIVADHAARDRRIGLNIGECRGDQATHEAVWVEVIRAFSGRFDFDFFAVTADDLPAIRRVIAAAGLPASTPIKEYYFDPRGFIEATRNLSLFIGLKLHAAGLALVAGTPSLFFAYEQKCRDFILPLDREACLLTLDMTPDEVIARIEHALDNPDRFAAAQEIGQIAARQRKMLRDHFGI